MNFSARFKLTLLIVGIALLVSIDIGYSQPPQQKHSQPFQNYSGSVSGPKIWLQERETVPVVHVGAGASAMASLGKNAQPLTMTAADVDIDGVPDLLVGYATPSGGVIALHRGNVDAFAPQSQASFQAIAHGRFPSPFLSQVNTFAVPVRPDFLATGNFTGNSRVDLVVAARGGRALYVLPGDGKGNFGAPQIFDVSGQVTALAGGRLGNLNAFDDVIVSVSDPKENTFSLSVYSGSKTGLVSLTQYPLSAPASNLVFDTLADSMPDLVFLSGGDVYVLRSTSMQVERIPLPLSASGLALGSFIYDRNAGLQLALVSSDGSIHIAAHSQFDPRVYTAQELSVVRQAGSRGRSNPLVTNLSFSADDWKVVESVPGVMSSASAQSPVFFRSRISSNGADDLMVLDPLAGQMSVISHPDAQPGAATFTPAQISVRPYSGSPVGALPLRTNIDARPGVVVIHRGEVAPSVMMPLPDPTFTVNTTADGVNPGACAAATAGQCTLREAVIEANTTAGTDTIMVPAGTYTLTLPKVAGDCTAQHGALYINDSVNIIGAGQDPTTGTVIQAGTNATNGVDFVMAVNEDLGSTNCPLTNASASISNLTLKFGHNNGTHGVDGDGGCMEYDTGSSGNANLTLDHVTLDSCSTTKGNGGGIAIFNASAGAGGGNGLATITNSIIQNNSPVDTTNGVAATAGGIWVSDLSRMSMSNSQVLNNHATQVNNVNTVGGEGGGVTITTQLSNSRQTVIHASTISGNHAGGNGGGIHDESNLLIDQGTVISNNSAGEANKVNGTNGGGLYISTSNNGCPAACTDTVTLTKVTITGNTTTGPGGALYHGNGTGAGNLTVSFSRLAGNTAADATNLFEDHSVSTVTNNWWGTNTPADTMDQSAGTITFDPFIVLTHTASPSTIKINQSTTLTADMSKDNHGSGTTLSGNLDEIVGLPVTFDNPVLGSIPQAQPETLANPVPTATATFNAGGTSGNGSADATVDQQTVTAPIVILEPLRITKSFSPTTVAINASSTLTFIVNNPNVIAVDGNFTDSLPANLLVASTPGVTNACGGTVTAIASSGSVSFSNASLAEGACTITVKVASAVDNIYNNSVTINSTAAGTGAQSTSSASLTVIDPPSITKTFGAATIPLNGTTSLSFSISNTNVNSTLSGIAFTDSLPAGLVVATPSSLTGACGGTATATPGSGSVSLSGGTLTAGTSCTISLNVKGTTAGVQNNSVQVSSTNGGTGNSSTASVTVIAPPTITQTDSLHGSTSLNGPDTLQLTITNPNPTPITLTGVGFTDTLSSGLAVAAGANNANCGGTLTATVGAQTFSLSGATIPGGSNCSLIVNVTGTAAGDQTSSSSAVTSTEGGNGNTTSITINVVAPPVISKTFNPSTIAVGATTSLQFTITNPTGNTVSETGVAFQDTLPTGLTVTPGTASACGGTVQTTQSSSSGGGISLSNATVAVGTPCQFSVTVTGAVSGQYTNTTAHVTSVNGGQGNTASANVTVASPAGITKSFGAATIPLNGTTSLSFSITNPNTSLGLTGVAFTDSLPAGLVVASTPNLSNACNGTTTAAAGGSSVSLTGGMLASNATCAVSVNVQGTAAGTKNNSVTVNSTEGGTGNTSNASVTVVGPPLISKVFGAAGIPLNGSTSLSFTINNPNAGTALGGVAFSDALPAGLIISTPNSLTGTCGSGTITATQSTGLVSLSGGTLAGSGSCTFSVNVTGTTAGTENNTTSAVTSTEGGTGTSTSASITVVAPPSIAKGFNPSAISLNATTSLTFTITNPAANTASEAGVAFTDTLPNGLTVVNGTSTVCGGTLTTTAPTGITLTGATITTNSQCQFSVTVTGTASGSYTNTTGNVTSTNGGTGNMASAGLTVATPPSMTKSFGVGAIPLNGTTSMTFNITNPNSGLSLSGVQFTDALPSGLIVSSPSATNSCGGAATVGSGGTMLSLSGGSIAAGGSCSVSATVQGTTAGVKTNSATVSSSDAGTGNTPSASITVVGPPAISKAFGAASIPLNGGTSLSFTIQNSNGLTLTGVGFTDTLPAGLVVSSPNGLTSSCGGTAAAAAGTISLSGGMIAASSACTMSLNVMGTTAGVKNNTTSAVSSNEGGSGGSGSATLFVVAPPMIAKSFSPSLISVNGTTSLGFAIANPPANTVALTGVAFTDVLPAGLTVSNGTAAACGGTLTTSGGNTISLSGATITVAGQCMFSVTVSATQPGTFTNVTGNVTSTNGGTGNTATAIVQSGDFSLQLSPNSETISPGHNGSFTLMASSSTGFHGAIGLTCSGGPVGSTCKVSPNSITLTSRSETAKVSVTLAIPRGMSKGTFTITVTGVGGGLTRTATATLTIGGVMNQQ